MASSRRRLAETPPPPGLENERISELIAETRAGDFRLTSRRYPARGVLPEHRHLEPGLTLVLQGSYSETDDSGSHRYCRGMAVVLAAPAEHANMFGPWGARDLNVYFPAAWIDRQPIDRRAGTLDPRQYDSATIPTTLLRELITPDALSPLVVESALLEMFARLNRVAEEERATPRWLKSAVRLVDAHFREDIRLAIVAEELRVDPVHLARTFRQYVGMSVGERVRVLRVRAACRLLAETREPIAEIAAACGFSDQSHLTRLLLRHVFMTPAQYRRSHRL